MKEPMTVMPLPPLLRRLRLLTLAVLLAAGFAAPPPALAETVAARPSFFSALPDVPVMQGLAEVPDQTYIFDVPEGRIIESLAELKDVAPAAVLEFYLASLPQLGWKSVEATGLSAAYAREQERLVLEFETVDSRRFLKLRVGPAAEPPN